MLSKVVFTLRRVLSDPLEPYVLVHRPASRLQHTPPLRSSPRLFNHIRRIHPGLKLPLAHSLHQLTTLVPLWGWGGEHFVPLFLFRPVRHGHDAAIGPGDVAAPDDARCAKGLVSLGQAWELGR